MGIQEGSKRKICCRIVPPRKSAKTRLHIPQNHSRGLFHYHPHVHGSVFFLNTLDMQLTNINKTKLKAQVRTLYPDVHEIERPIRNAKLSKELLKEMDFLLDLSAEDCAGMGPLPFAYEFTMGDVVMKDGFYYKPCYINHALFDGSSIRGMILGRVQEWVIINRRNESDEVTLKSHPFHLHTNAFQIMDMSHGPVDYEVGEWRDVVSVFTPGNVTICFRPEDYTGIVVAYCHVLGHSDAGMIAGVEMVAGDCEDTERSTQTQ
ncbi:unnamed protein product [Peronospora destructor]|uniref:Plastocyanin-like domain-containing protein n=1 Tax=Peronospora destructor TaxID=86335 RepID=A0AAV0UM35_9STRA|nr:unnamed protein product [Peronospora destructor]